MKLSLDPYTKLSFASIYAQLQVRRIHEMITIGLAYLFVFVNIALIFALLDFQV